MCHGSRDGFFSAVIYDTFRFVLFIFIVIGIETIPTAFCLSELRLEIILLITMWCNELPPKFHFDCRKLLK